MSKIKLKFDPITHIPEVPTMILVNKNDEKINQVIPRNIVIKDSMVNPCEISFDVYKIENNIKNHLWDKIVNFRLLWCKEWNTLFEISLDINESNKTTKHITCTQLGHAELSKIKLFNIEINTEKDIVRDDYKITILFDNNNPKVSLLHRILEKAPHYQIAHVDPSIAKIQRTFSFDNISIDDAFKEIAEEIGCIFVYDVRYDDNGNIVREISVYDLQQNCNECGHRGEFTDKCPICGSYNIKDGYGEDTTIFISSDEIANDLKLTTDTNAVNNCFKLEAGDDLMTATIRNCNPNGTDYIWYFSDDMEDIMSSELISKLHHYNELYNYYQNDYSVYIDTDLLNKYNNIVLKYNAYNQNLEQIKVPITGYPNLMTAYYNTIDLSLFLQSILMPDAKISDTSAQEQSALLTTENLSPIAVTSLKNITISTVNSAVLSMAKSIIDPRYQTKIDTSTFSNNVWRGNFIITNYSDEEDTATTNTIALSITDEYEKYVKQRIDKLLNKEANDLSISGLFKKNNSDFCNELKKYCLDSLNSFYNICQSCIDILIEQGIADEQTWADKNPNLYNELYLTYRNKLNVIQSEISTREKEINIVTGITNEDHVSYGLQTYLTEAKQQIQNELNLEKYLGNELWLELCAFRREDVYSNSNFISDGLNNSELFSKALEFLENANKELYKSSTQQHSISSNLKNIFAIKRFEPLYQYFEVSNWLRIMIDDRIYKLRLLEYEIDYNNLSNLSTVEFSDVLRIIGGVSDSKSIFDNAISISTSYDYVQKQAEQGSKSNQIVNGWTNNGLDVSKTKILSGANGQTQTWDEHGILLRKYDSITDTYYDEQTRILNGSIFITNDNWKTVKTAVGGYYYYDPVSNELKYSYGVNAETLIGKLILGENLGIYNENGTLTFDDKGFRITNGKNTFSVNPSNKILLSLSNEKEDILYVDESGNLHLKGDGNSLDISTNDITKTLSSKINQNNRAIQLEVERAIENEGLISSQITTTADSINLELSKKVGSNEIISKINASTEELFIQFNKIKLEGITTVNNNFKVLEDGSIEAKNASFSGDITGSSGEFTKSFKVSSPYNTKYGEHLFYIETAENSEDPGTMSGIEIGVLNGSYTTYRHDGLSLGSEQNVTIHSPFNIELSTFAFPGQSFNPGDIDLYGNINLHGDTTVSSGFEFNVGGTKSRIVTTENYNTRKLYCYEMASPIFGDIGHGVI